MNERIKDVLKQATNPDYDSNDGPMNEVDLEKFADLLIQEFAYNCIDVTNEGERIQFVAKIWGVEI
jgi:hypothetical protein